MTSIQSSIIYYPGYSQQQVRENLIWQVILSITNSNPCVITTENIHRYPSGVNIRFQIPNGFGMIELNALQAQVISVTDNTLTINLDTSNFSLFSYPSPLPSAYTPATLFADSSGPYLPPLPLPYGNQDSFEGVVYNNGSLGNPINGM